MKCMTSKRILIYFLVQQLRFAMSFWSKISQNKIALWATVGAILGGTVFWAYKQYEKEEEGEVENGNQKNSSQVASVKQFDLKGEINKLKAEVNMGDLSIQDAKKIFRLITEYVRSKTLSINTKNKIERRKRFPKEVRFTYIGQYMKETTQSIMQLQNAMMQMQNEQGQIMASFGLTQASMAKYASQLGSFMQELQVDIFGFNGDLNLENTRTYLQLKTEYLQVHGERLVQAMIELASTLPLQEKQIIPIFFNIFLSDEVFEHQPDLDRDEFELSAQHYKSELTAESICLERVLLPLMGKLQTVLAGDQMGGFGGFGNSYPEEYENNMGGGFSQEAMEQQLEMIRQQDPQAYEQLMAMMQAQMGR